MAAAAPCVQVGDLHKALEAVVTKPGARRSLVASSLRARDAAPLLELVRLQEGMQDGEEAWRIGNSSPVKKMARAAALLLLLEVSVLPSLRIRPTSAKLLDALDNYAARLRETAAAAGGSFNTDANIFADRVVAHVDASRALPPYSPDGALRAGVDDLITKAHKLLDANCTISQVITQEDDEDEEGDNDD